MPKTCHDDQAVYKNTSLSFFIVIITTYHKYLCVFFFLHIYELFGIYIYMYVCVCVLIGAHFKNVT